MWPPFRIASAEDLGAINHHDLAAYYRLEADIDLAGIAWGEAPIQYFGGHLDGAGRVVTGLTLQGVDGLGLFGDLGLCASVANLGIRDANLTGENVVGLLAARNRGSIAACRADGVVAGDCEVGILVGWSEGAISDSYATGAVKSGYAWGEGGLVGYNTGAVRSSYAAAHIAWLGRYSADVTGGLVGINQMFGVTGEISDSYFLIDAEGGGPDNGAGVPLTNAQMKEQASFPSWDFDSIWTISGGKDYPRLRWEVH